MSNRGFGLGPFGVGPWGFGSPAVATSPGGKTLADEGQIQHGSREISNAAETRGQYVFDEHGRHRGMPNVRHMVLLAYTTEQGSAIVRDLGHRFAELRTIGGDFRAQLIDLARLPIQRLLDRGWVRIDDVRIRDSATGALKGRVDVTIVLTDLSTNQPIEVDL